MNLRPLACWTAGSNPTGGIDAYLVNVVCCVGMGLRDGPIPHPEESYRVCVGVSSSVIKRMFKGIVERKKERKFICNFFLVLYCWFFFFQPFKDEAQTALFKDPVRTAQ